MTIAQGEYKSQVGLDMLYFAPITKDDATGYTAGLAGSSWNSKIEYIQQSEIAIR